MTVAITAPAYRLDEQVGYLLRRVSQRHAAIFQAGSPDGLTPTQFAALVRLAEVGRCSQNQLGRLTAMDVATIKGVVSRLEAKGLIRLGADPDDRRRTVITLSPLGDARIADLHDAGRRITEETLAPLNDAERAQLAGLLARLT